MYAVGADDGAPVLGESLPLAEHCAAAAALSAFPLPRAILKAALARRPPSTAY
jgi:hypothetical protein